MKTKEREGEREGGMEEDGGSGEERMREQREEERERGREGGRWREPGTADERTERGG